SGSLTKYWAHGGNGFKLRGIEARQHSTCEWVRQMQIRALEVLMQNISEGGKFDSLLVQKKIIGVLEDSLRALNANLVSPKELVITKRVTKRIHEFAVTTTTQLALIRAKNLGHEIPPGRKVRYVVTKPVPNDPPSRVILSEELTKQNLVNVDVEFYKGLAIRAIWAVLGPFGWTDDEIINGKKKFTLFDFFDSFDTKSAMDDFTC
ncbi:MAG: DNA polymerase domain-containing protein, partial [Euryarchaeota archaeon]